MTRAELKHEIKESIDYFVYRLGLTENPHLSKRDIDEVARPVATLAVLSAFAGNACGHLSSYPSVTRTYLISLSFIVRAEGTFVPDMTSLIYDMYEPIRRVVSDDDELDNWDLCSVIDDMYEEAKIC